MFKIVFQLKYVLFFFFLNYTKSLLTESPEISTTPEELQFKFLNLLSKLKEFLIKMRIKCIRFSAQLIMLKSFELISFAPTEQLGKYKFLKKQSVRESLTQSDLTQKNRSLTLNQRVVQHRNKQHIKTLCFGSLHLVIAINTTETQVSVGAAC